MLCYVKLKKKEVKLIKINKLDESRLKFKEEFQLITKKKKKLS